MHQVRRFLTQVATRVDEAVPGSCILCNNPALKPICAQCENELPRLGKRCQCCALPTTTDTALCGECLQTTPAFERTYSAFIYQGYVPWLINRFKHQHALIVGQQLSEHLLAVLPQTNVFDLIVPVPLHWSGLVQRGFNQAEVIARPLAHHLKLPVDHCLKKTAFRRHQQTLNRAQRQRAVRNSYAITRDVRHRHILLVDDVMTTGATVGAIAQLLRDAGANRVDIACLARTPKT